MTALALGTDQAVVLRIAFDVAIDQLTQPGQVRIDRDNGTSTTANTACLLDQLAEFVAPGGEHSGAATVAGSKPPVALGTLALIAEIGVEMRRALAVLGEARHALLTDQLHAWAGHADQWQHTDPGYLAYAADRAAGWVRNARALVEPKTRYPLRGKTCPACLAAIVHVWSDDYADYVRRPALEVDTDRVEAVCLACRATWNPDLWEQLARVLDQQRQETLAVAHNPGLSIVDNPGDRG